MSDLHRGEATGGQAVRHARCPADLASLEPAGAWAGEAVAHEAKLDEAALQSLEVA